MGATLITGITGGLAQHVAKLLLDRGDDVIGVDYRELRAMPTGLERMQLHRASYNKTAIEDVFRKHPIDVVLHLGRVGNLSEEMGKRFDLNVMGTQKVMDLCVRHRVSTLVVLSTFHVYGAHPRNHTPIYEDDPLRAGTEFPQIGDAIQLDGMAATWTFRHPEVRTVVLRPTNVVGPNISNTMSGVLRLPFVPYLAGFNPMTQFIHEQDLASAIVSARDGRGRGVYNVAGGSAVPWRTALSLCDARIFPLPSSLAAAYVGLVTPFPRYLVNFLKFPCVISDAAFRRDFGWESRIDVRTTLTTAVAQARAAQRGRG